MQWDSDDGDIDPGEMDRIGRILSELEEADFDLVDPPAGTWDGIEASITSERATVPPSRDTPPRIVVEYRIDAADVVASVGEGWADFARDNGAPGLAVEAPDRVLWAYMDRDEIRELWQLLVQRVRTLGVEARVPFRCDAPHARRWFEMAITPEHDDRVCFRSVLVFEEARPPVALLDQDAQRDAEARPVPLCSWCGRGEHRARWLDVEELVRVGRLLEQATMPPVSYGICGDCRAEMSAELLVPGTAGRTGPGTD